MNYFENKMKENNIHDKVMHYTASTFKGAIAKHYKVVMENVIILEALNESNSGLPFNHNGLFLIKAKIKLKKYFVRRNVFI